jgi:hypothetical protein
MLTAAAFEQAVVIGSDPSHAGQPPAWEEYRKALRAAGCGIPLEPLSVPECMAATSAADLALAVSAGDERLFTSLLLTLGVVLQD